MNNLRKLIGIILIIAIIVCAMTSCDLLDGLGGGGVGSSTPTKPTTPGSGTVTGVSLNKSSVTLLVGGTEALTPTITPSNATNQNLTWTSSNTSAATVSPGGLVTAVAAGTAIITVKTQDGDKTAICTVTVNPVPVNSVSLKSSTSLIVGGTETLYGVIDPPNASNKSVTWDSNNTGVATVSANGTVTAVAAGTATITVKTADGNKTAACSVNVVTSAVAVNGVSLNKSSTSLNVGSSESLFAAISPSTATNQSVTWSSSNTSVATVSAGGLVTAVAVGTATVTVKTQDGDKTAACTVTVNPIAVSDVSLTKSSTSLAVGGSEPLYPIITPSNATNQNVTWTSSNASIATVSAGGLVTAVADGTANITVTTVDGNKTATCNVTVIDPISQPFTSIEAFRTWLYAQPANTKNNPLTVYLNLSSLDLEGDGLLINPPIKYLNLDFSGSTFTSIKNGTFRGCDSLIGITIPTSVTRIGDTAFQWCHSLTSVIIPDSVTSIGAGAFEDCRSLKSITIPNSVTSIGNSAFRASFQGNNIPNLTIPNSVTSIGDYAFQLCDLVSVTIGSGVTNIGKGAFSSCKSLTSITVPASVTSIGDYAFGNCDSLAAINVASGNSAYTSENDVLFNKNKTTLICHPGDKTGSFTIPNSVTRIEDRAFSACYKLVGVTIPNSVTSIGDEAFYYCSRLTSVAIPDSVTSIGEKAFYFCFSLTSVTFQGTISPVNIHQYLFDGDLRAKYLAGGPGTYTRSGSGTTTSPYTWTITSGGNPPNNSGIELVLLDNANNRDFAIEARLDATEWANVINRENSTGVLYKISNKVYEKFEDKFDFIFFVLNYVPQNPNAVDNDPIIQQLGFKARNIAVSNNVKGLGINEYSRASSFGSAGKLKSIMYFPFHTAIKEGPSLHEIAHNWGVNICPTYYPDNSYSGGHWGVSNAGGLLGGFKYVRTVSTSGGTTEYQASMFPEKNPDGSFKNVLFGVGGYANNFIPYSDIELYLMGMIGADVLRANNFKLDVYTGLSYEPERFNNGYFKATGITQYTIDDLINLNGNGPRVPDASKSQKSFKVLTVIMSKSGDTSASTRYDEIVENVKWFAGEPDNTTWLYNFKEATGGKGSLEVNGIINSLKH